MLVQKGCQMKKKKVVNLVFLILLWRKRNRKKRLGPWNKGRSV